MTQTKRPPKTRGGSIGGGAVIASCCDLTIVTPQARFGVPIARTLGNCLLVGNVARLVRAFGEGPAKAMLLLSDLLDGRDAHRLGFACRCVERADLSAALEAVLERVLQGAPLTLAATRETFARLRGALAANDEIVERVYASADFREGVQAFLERRRPQWRGI